MKKLILSITLLLMVVIGKAQPIDNKRMMFNHLEIGVTAGSTGFGIEAAMPCTKYLRIRAGVEAIPRFAIPMSFDITSYREDATKQTEFSKLQDIMRKVSGFEVDQKVNMETRGTMVNAKVMVDVYPWLQNRHWHLTVGFYYGSRRIANAVNTREEMTSMLAIGQYNNMREYFMDGRYMDEPIIDNNYLDPDLGDELAEKFESYGRIGVHVGNFADGTPYMMEPGADGCVRARVYVKRFKPYLGVGYDSAVTKDGRLTVGFDAGCMFWGGKPKILTHEGVDLSKDVTGIAGKVGDYVDLMSSFKVYPSINFRIAWRLF